MEYLSDYLIELAERETVGNCMKLHEIV